MATTPSLKYLILAARISSIMYLIIFIGILFGFSWLISIGINMFFMVVIALMSFVIGYWMYKVITILIDPREFIKENMDYR